MLRFLSQISKDFIKETNHCSHFTDGKTEVQGVQVICPRLWQRWELDPDCLSPSTVSHPLLLILALLMIFMSVFR